MHPRPPSKVLKVHPEQLPPQVRQAIDALRASPVEPPCFLVGQGWRGGVDSVGFARHLVKVGDLDGDLVILTADTVGDVCIVQVLRTCVILKLYAKQEKIWVDFRYEDRETCKAAWPRWKAARVHYFDALAAGDEARARSLDPLHDWASAGYPVGPVPEHVEKARAARRAKEARARKIKAGCCLGIVALVALAGVGLVGRRILQERDRDAMYAERAARFRAEAMARAHAEAHPPTTPLPIEPTMARIGPSLASPEASAFVRALLKDLSERPDAERWVAVDRLHDQASAESVDAEMRRRGSSPLGSQRMWLPLPLSAERLTADVFGRLGLPGLRFQDAASARGATPRPKLTVRITERLSRERYRAEPTGFPFFGIDLVIDVEATIPGRPERLSLHHESSASPARGTRVSSSEGPRSIHERDRQRAADSLHPRIAAMFIRQ